MVLHFPLYGLRCKAAGFEPGIAFPRLLLYQPGFTGNALAAFVFSFRTYVLYGHGRLHSSLDYA